MKLVRRSRSILTLMFVLTALLPALAEEQTHESVDAARRVFRQALDAMGMPATLDALGSVDVTWKGRRNWGPTLSASPNPPHGTLPDLTRVAMDFSSGDAYWEMQTQYHGGEPIVYRRFRRGDYRRWTGSEGFGMGSYQELDSDWGQDPIALLRLDFVPALMFMGSQGKELPMRVETSADPSLVAVALTRPDGSTTHLYFDRSTHLFSHFERPQLDELLGEMTRREFFENYRQVGKYRLPMLRRRMDADVETVRLEARYVVGKPLPADLFRVPEHYTKEEGRFDAPPGVTELTTGVYVTHMQHNQHMVFVEMPDHFVALIAPWSAAMVEQGLELLGDRRGDKPIRHVGLTSHWWDASAGMRALVARGARVITTPDAADYFRQMATADYGRFADVQSERQRTPEFTLVRSHKTLGRGKRRIEVFKVDGGPGKDVTLFFYVPRAKLLVSVFGFEPSYFDGKYPAGDGTRFLAHKVHELGLDVTHIVHNNGGIGTWEQVQQALRLRDKVEAHGVP